MLLSGWKWWNTASILMAGYLPALCEDDQAVLPCPAACKAPKTLSTLNLPPGPSSSRALEAARQAEDEEKRRRDREKEEQRRATYEDARRQEAERVAEVLRRAADKDADLAALAREREAEAARKALERRLQLKHKAEAVEQMKRRDAFERAEALKRIEEETSHAQALLAQRSALQVCDGATMRGRIVSRWAADGCYGAHLGASSRVWQACKLPVTLASAPNGFFGADVVR